MEDMNHTNRSWRLQFGMDPSTDLEVLPDVVDDIRCVHFHELPVVGVSLRSRRLLGVLAGALAACIVRRCWRLAGVGCR
jgi:hypothetical protein